jgi:MFS family permease
MNVLDSSIANVSIPAISGNLGVSPQQGTWVITSFAVANAISVPLTGWLTTVRASQIVHDIDIIIRVVVLAVRYRTEYRDTDRGAYFAGGCWSDDSTVPILAVIELHPGRVQWRLRYGA